MDAMQEVLSPNKARMQLKKQLESDVASAFKTLLESKHLYQTLHFNPEELISEMQRRVESGQGEYAMLEFRALAYGEWLANDPYLAVSGIGQAGSLTKLFFSMPDLKLFCNQCKRAEAFNSISTREFLGLEPRIGYETTQVFVASFLCQSCKEIPEVFLIRREGAKLTICGRTPLETVDVPKVIPKMLARHYSNSVIAHYSGQSLAANFLLRSLIEQWARRNVPNANNLKADEILDQYMETLPSDFRSRFTSLRALYGQLSSDIHRAAGDAQLFATALEAVNEHFEARRLYKLDEPRRMSQPPSPATTPEI